MVGFNFAPRGWSFTEGQLLAISSHSALFSLYGTIYGGDGRTTFALPDLRGRVPIHHGNGPGLSTYSIGERGGTESVVLTTNQIPSHHHVVTPPAENSSLADLRNPADATWGSDSGADSTYTKRVANTTMLAFNSGNTGGSQDHTNIQPFLSISFCCALVGLFPSRN